MKEKIMKLASVILVVGMLVSVMGIPTEAASKKVKLNKKTFNVRMGSSVKLKVKNKAKKAKVTWKSKNQRIATVSKKGKVKGCKVGSTKIICTVKNGSKKIKLSCQVKVTKKNMNNYLPNVINSPEVEVTPSEKPSEVATQKPTQKPTAVATQKPTEKPTDLAETTSEEISTGSAKVSVGMTLNKMEEAMGKTSYTLPSEYDDCNWYVYNADYSKFSMVLVKDNKVVGVYVDGKDFSYGNINSNTTASALTTAGFASNSYKETYYKTAGNISVSAYVDTLGDKTVEGVLVMQKMSSTIKSDTCKTYEKISFELTNAFRVKNGLPTLKWNEQVADVARAHSKDMRDNNYFDHTSPSGAGPGERLTNAGLSFMAYAENIAMGYENGIEVTYGWINSSGHRSNMLFESVTDLGVGVESNCTYYTQVFYKGR